MNIEEKVAAKAAAEGKAKKALEIARRMLRENFSIELIARVCGLPSEEIRKIRQSELARN